MNLLTTKTTVMLFELISAELWIFGTHFRTKTLLCPARACPLCAVERPKRRGYAIAKVPQTNGPADEGLIEFGQDVLDQMINRFQLDPSNVNGTRWRLARRTDRPGWIVSAAGRNEAPHVPHIFALADSIETLYGLPFKIDDQGEIIRPSSPGEWHRAQQHALESRAFDAIRDFARRMSRATSNHQQEA